MPAQPLTPGHLAAITLDALPDNPPYSFSTTDLLAITLLDLMLEPQAVRTLLETRSRLFSDLLEDTPTDIDLWNATDDDLHATEVWYTPLNDLPGVGQTRVTKLMARRRSRLILIVDGVIRNSLPLGPDSRKTLRRKLAS